MNAFLISNLFLTCFSIIPLWNLKLSSIDLLQNRNNHIYTINEKEMYGLKVKLQRNIYKSTDGKLKYENELFIDNNSKGKVDFENIESFYKYDQIHLSFSLLCPMGKYHPFYINNMEQIINHNLDQSDIDWNLKCYYHRTNFFFAFYLNKEGNHIFDLQNDKSFVSYPDLQMGKELYDYILVNKEGSSFPSSQEDNYPICALVKENNTIQFARTEYILNKNNNLNNGSTKQKKYKKLIESKNYSQANFYNKSKNFCYFTYNNIYDFSSGFSIKTIECKKNDYSNEVEVEFENNNTSPFEFIDEVEIKEMKFIYYTQYVYYSIANLKTNEIYHGVLDITLNKVIFNTNEDIDIFIPYSDNSMLAITKESAYRICFIKDNNNSCINECSSDNIIHDIDGNKCGIDCEGKFLIIPEEVCSPECNNNTYISHGHYCGLCRDLDNINKYKLINGTDCLSDIIEGSEIYNSRLYLLVCKSGYILYDNKCIPHCFETCRLCTEFSMDISNQKCIYCKEGYFLENENCIKINFEHMAFEEFKNFFKENNISLYINSSNIINGLDFKALISLSNDLIINDQIHFFKSTIDIQICPQLKAQYNISDNESLIILITQIKNNEINTIEKKYFNLGIKILLNIFDLSGRKLDFSICEENIKMMHHLEGYQDIDLKSAKKYAIKGIDVFNATDSFFNDLCYPYDNKDNKDIIIFDRRNDIYQNVIFCQDECLYKGINFNTSFANCLCSIDSIGVIYDNITDENKKIKKEQNGLINFKTLRKTFTSNLFVSNIDVINCHNLIFDLNILKKNIGFYFYFITFLIQIILFFIFLYKKLVPIKIYMLNINSNNQVIIIKRVKVKKNSIIIKKKKKMKRKSLIFKSTIQQKNNFIKRKSMPMIDYNSQIHLVKNNGNISTLGNNSNKVVKDEFKLEKKEINTVINPLIILMKENDLNEMDYEEIIKKEKRTCLRMYWAFFVYSQINLGTFCTEIKLNLFVIKLSFLVYTFEISFFLNAFFYSDKYISDAYHNNGILNFVSGLPKSIYSSIFSSVITILLSMLSNSENEFRKLMKEKNSNKDYEKLVDDKLNKFRNKLIFYYILIFSLNISFIYFVSAFCAVYRYSQKYLLFGFFESFAINFFVANIVCIFISLFRYMSIQKRMKYFHTFSNVIKYLL